MTKSRSKKNDEKNDRKGIVFHTIIKNGDGIGFPLSDGNYVHVDFRPDGIVKVTATKK